MGTRADFYVGRGADSEWIGSIAWDGYPEGIDDVVLSARSEEGFRSAVSAMFAGRNDTTLPSAGWPWPWQTSATTDYAYAYDDGQVWASGFDSPWWPAEEDRPEDPLGPPPEWPDMTKIQNVSYGANSGLIMLGGR